MDLGIVDSMNYRLNVVHFSTSVSPYRDRILKKGDFIVFDGGPSYKGYVADVQRMLHIGDPGKEIRRLGRLAARAHEAVEDILKAGVTAGELWRVGYPGGRKNRGYGSSQFEGVDRLGWSWGRSHRT